MGQVADPARVQQMGGAEGLGRLAVQAFLRQAAGQPGVRGHEVGLEGQRLQQRLHGLGHALGLRQRVAGQGQGLRVQAAPRHGGGPLVGAALRRGRHRARMLSQFGLDSFSAAPALP